MDPTIKKKALLVSLQVAGQSDEDHQGSILELGRLVTTLGFEVIGQVSQKRPKPSPGSVVGEGKLREIAEYTGGPGVVASFSTKKKSSEVEEDELPDDASPAFGEKTIDQKAGIIVIDCELTPTQLKNLEEASGVEVLDRTGVILEIFSRHAHSTEARLQIEIAKLNYLAPRLRASSVGADRQGGGIGAKGAGETSHELDRRRIRDRVVELKAQLEMMHSKHKLRRQRRRENQVIALVGYTNAGKSSLMRALTGSEVLVADKLFATLDTKVRALQPASVPAILVSDTVGFIKKLPHDLVASFRSTLDEAMAASLLLITVDASDPSFRSQLAVTEEVLGEIEAAEIPRLLIMNKIDCLSSGDLQSLQEEYPEAAFISTRNPQDVHDLRQRILDFFEREMLEREFVLPYTEGSLLGEIRKQMRVISEDYQDQHIVVRLKAPAEIFEWLDKKLAALS